MPDDTDYIRVSKTRLLEVKQENDSLQESLEALREEHESLRSHLTGSIQEVTRLKEENESLKNRLSA